MLGSPNPIRHKPIFWQWQTFFKRGDNWPAVRADGFKLLVDSDQWKMELFQFPKDRLEIKNVAETNPVELGRLLSLIDGWNAELRTNPSEKCFSSLRNQGKPK